MKMERSGRASSGHFSSLSAFMREATKNQKLEVFRQASEKACEVQNKMLERARAVS